LPGGFIGAAISRCSCVRN